MRSKMHNCTIFDLDLIVDTRSAGPAARLAPDLTEEAVEKVWRRYGEGMEKTWRRRIKKTDAKDPRRSRTEKSRHLVP